MTPISPNTWFTEMRAESTSLAKGALNRHSVIDIARFLSIFLVVLIHVSPPTVAPNSHSPSVVVFSFIRPGLTNGAVPLFFLISGYLFFRDFAPDNYLPKLRRRVRSLIMPYVLWSAIYVIAIQLWYRSPWAHPQAAERNTLDFFHLDSLRSVFLQLTISSPAPQFWFLRDLIVLVFLSPILYWLIRRGGLIFVLPFAVAWAMNINAGMSRFAISSTGLTFFTLGAVFAQHQAINVDSTYALFVSLLGWFITGCLRQYVKALWLPDLLPLETLCAIAVIWETAQLIHNTSWRHLFAFCAQFSFVIYAGHILTENLLEKTFRMFGLMTGDVYPIGAMAVTCVNCTFWLVAGIGMSLVWPNCFRILSGGRIPHLNAAHNIPRSS